MNDGIDFKELSRAALPHAKTILAEVFPNGRLVGNEFLVGSILGEDGKSLKFNVKKGYGEDFSTDDKFGDIIALVAAARGTNQFESAKWIQSKIGNSTAPSSTVKTTRQVKHTPPLDNPTPSKSDLRINGLGDPVGQWSYLDKNGVPLGFHVARYETEDEKTFRPFSYKDGKWKIGDPDGLLPLYGLELLTARPNDNVLVVEGEGTCDAARILYPNVIVVTWPHGSKAVDKVDWSPLHGRKIRNCPDADDPGNKAAAKIAKILHQKIGVKEIKIIDTGAGQGEDGTSYAAMPKSWDLGDAVKDGWTTEQFVKWVKPRLKKYDPPPQEMAEKKLIVGDVEVCRDWEKPILFDDVKLPPFPENVFPKWVQEYVLGIRDFTETPLELSSMMALAVLSTCVARVLRIEIKPDYSEPLNLWLCPSLEPGNRKTEVVNKLTAPLTLWEKNELLRLTPEIRDTTSRRKSEDALINSLRNKLGGIKNPEERKTKIAEITDLEAKLTEIPGVPSLWTSDVTPERLGVLLYENNERFALLSDEGGIFDLMGGRYSSGVPNLDLFLKAHSGSPDRTDRMSRKVMLDHPALTIGISPQPSVLKGLAGTPAFRGRGLLARFLYVLPRSPVGERKGTSVPVTNLISQSYFDGISTLLRFQPKRDKNEKIPYQTLTLAPEAFECWQRFWVETETKLDSNHGTLRGIKDWGAKLPGAAGRIAGVLHAAQHIGSSPWEIKVSRDTMLSALQIAETLSHHALAAFGIMGADLQIEDAKHVFRWICRERLAQFTKRDCHNALQSRFGRLSELEPALMVLKERHYVRLEPAQKVSHRPSVRYEVNPELANTWQ